MTRKSTDDSEQSLVPISVYEDIPDGLTVGQRVTSQGQRMIRETARECALETDTEHRDPDEFPDPEGSSSI